MKLQIFSIATLAILHYGNAALEKAKVNSIPDCGPLQSNWYSGYYNATQTKQLHYVLVESENDPTKDPLIVWFAGGPGCSSYSGLFIENGPMIFDNGFLKPNPYPWTKNASMLYIESPAGIGHTYAADNESRQHNDISVTQDSFNVLQQFFQDYSEFITVDLYTSGYSYGGLYAPYLTWQLHQHNLIAKMDPTNSTTIYNIKGFIVGNGATDWRIDNWPVIPEVMYNYNLIPLEVYDSIQNNSCTKYFRDVFPTNTSQVCQDAWKKFDDVTAGIDLYELFANPWAKFSKKGYGEELEVYLERQDVRDALHIPDYIPYGFKLCSSNITFNLFYEGSVWIYHILKEYGYKMLHYSGDADSIVSSLGTKKWIDQQNFNITKNWTQWKVDGNFAGFFIEYENTFTYAQVHGAGHEASSERRQQVAQMVTNFIQNKSIG